ncbi:proline dehydrogenase family protein [Sulfitobacter marinivivus]|uniref:proline dehydrogenase family protein n=1 Tax=Sulfitobacter marinivivus TaxID=3158558 RepID=UPI003F6F9D69
MILRARIDANAYADPDEVLARRVETADLSNTDRAAGMGLNVDAKEADRLGLSLDVIDAVMGEAALAGWDGFGIVVQAYGPRAADVIDALYEMSEWIHAGNIYINRNQIGAIVASQPFGGEGLSGTGPKVGGPFYMERFEGPDTREDAPDGAGKTASLPALPNEVSQILL